VNDPLITRRGIEHPGLQGPITWGFTIYADWLTMAMRTYPPKRGDNVTAA
jgi:hypothetical protein